MKKRLVVGGPLISVTRLIYFYKWLVRNVLVVQIFGDFWGYLRNINIKVKWLWLLLEKLATFISNIY